jgi:type IV secretory pathway VirB9-like protein
LGGQIRSSPTLATVMGNSSLKALQAGGDHLDPWTPASTLTFVQPIGGRLVPTLSVATTTRRQLVFNPTWATLDSWHQVIRSRRIAFAQRCAAPHTRPSIAIENDGQAG